MTQMNLEARLTAGTKFEPVKVQFAASHGWEDAPEVLAKLRRGGVRICKGWRRDRILFVQGNNRVRAMQHEAVALTEDSFEITSGNHVGAFRWEYKILS